MVNAKTETFVEETIVALLALLTALPAFARDGKETENHTHTKPQRNKEMTENEIGKIVVNCAMRLHMELGPGLLETVYEVLLVQMLREAGLKVERQVPIPIEFHGNRFDEGFRADIIVEDKVILELKSVEKFNNAHKKQVLTYLKLTYKKLGYLLNFGEALMKDGISRVLNGQVE